MIKYEFRANLHFNFSIKSDSYFSAKLEMEKKLMNLLKKTVTNDNIEKLLDEFDIVVISVDGINVLGMCDSCNNPVLIDENYFMDDDGIIECERCLMLPESEAEK